MPIRHLIPRRSPLLLLRTTILQTRPFDRVAVMGEMDFNASSHPQHPKRLVFAPGDIAGPQNDELKAAATIRSAASHLADDIVRSDTSTPTSAMQVELLSHPARAHQFVINPPLHISHLHPTNPLHQFHKWFKDPRIPRSSAPETCTLATASLPSGRVSARMLYFKELDERGWVIYSNWGSKEGKGGQVFGPEYRASADGSVPGDIHQSAALNQGNRWAALTFLWALVERQVRIEGVIEPLSREESEMYWRTRERNSQIGAWASWQSKVLWSVGPEGVADDLDDGRAELERRVKDTEARFADVKDIPLPPFWGGIRLVPESVEFWQGRAGRLHDRFRYVREGQTDHTAEDFKWRIERLSP
ncbi:pyridoxamine-phosphate oxidase [Talaromyces proteolyticus]|uniref:pyridoxal 5'-phosphate synthase n=1 Tax=Talaromyces proteolyticus TaxID=1131652 RepID=A0AAD4KU77_9EURO|nr:pyridoxamine-phosphate oxidase [Talaromyces proteolyticus]KAH8696149.1 pyridoxamine-phosphate oxidase [Talaromyces proteolyticus]